MINLKLQQGETVLDRITIIFFYIALCSIGILVEHRSSLMLIIFSVLVIIRAVVQKEVFKFNKRLMPLLLLFIPSVSNLFIEPNIDEGLFDITQKLPFLILPFILGQFDPSRKVLERGMLYFAFSTVGICLWTYRGGNFFAWGSSEIYDYLILHRPILGMYGAISIVIIYTQKTLGIWIRLLYIGFIIFTLIIILAKASWIMIILIPPIIIVNIFIKSNNTKKFIGLTYIVSIMLLFFLFILPKVVSFIETKKATLFENNIVFSVRTRSQIWNCVQSVDQGKILGYGIGLGQKKLNECYKEKYDGSEPAVHLYNPHNQFLATKLYYGYFGLLLLIGFMGMIIFQADSRNILLSLTFILVFIIFSLFESTFQVYKSMSFIAWMAAIVLIYRKHLG